MVARFTSVAWYELSLDLIGGCLFIMFPTGVIMFIDKQIHALAITICVLYAM